MKHRKIVLTVEHMKDGPDGAILGFELVPVVVGTDEDGSDITSCIVRSTAASTFVVDEGPDLHPQALLALNILRECISDCGENPKNDNDVPEDTKAVARKVWRNWCKERRLVQNGGDEAFKKAFIRARKALVEASLIAISGSDNVYLIEDQGGE